MARVPKREADPWWHLIVTEMRVGYEEEGLFTRIVIQPGITKASLTIIAEIWETHPEIGGVRKHMYSREYPHGDHNFFSGACWQACMQVWAIRHTMQDHAERERAAAEGNKVRNR